jgi:excisionase family DNA binding protein
MKLLKVNEVATILDVSVARAYELARTGVLPSVRLGRQVRIAEEALRNWIQTGGRDAPSEGGRASAPVVD